MKILERFLHLFTPRESNNHKARLLSPSAIYTSITVLLIFQVFLTGVARFRPEVLGYAANITVTDLLRYTNEKRTAAGAESVLLDEQLAEAARKKAEDMFARQYWAHSSPDGRDPWSFIVASGYRYLFAGENLARDFGDSRSVVEAWMNSPSHRENLLNERYRDIGFAIVNGKYNGYETTLVVQMFGARSGGTPTVTTTESSIKNTESREPEKPRPITAVEERKASAAGMVASSVRPPVRLDIYSVTKNTTTGLVVLLAGVLVVDSILVYRRRTVRLSGHNFAHLLLMLAVLAALNLIGRTGIIL